MKKQHIFLSLFFAIISSVVFSQDLVYRSINPFLGGTNTFNYQQLLASATAQNDFQESGQDQQSLPTDIENFTASLNRQLLNSLSQSLFQQQIGVSGLTIGTYVFGSLVVEVTQAAGGLSVSILNTITGEQTQIVIPNN
jgi:curli production assembly/transport component CsgF